MTLALAPPPVTDSPLARLDPRWKLAGLAIAVVATAAVRSPWPAAAALVAALILTAFARLPPAWLVLRLGGLMIALLPFAVVMPLVDGVDGLRLAALLVLKGSAVVLLVLVGLGTAPLPVNLHAARALHLPGTFIHILLLSYRYLFVLGDELERLRRAVRVRGFRPRMDRHSYRTVGHVIGTLVVRGTERAEGVAHAMRCRGFDGRFRSLATFRTAAADVAFLGGTTAFAVAVLAWDLLC
jgi:cobalt/nickel transport system permease protein